MFKIGDVVQMKSGGPAMSVVSTTDEKAECLWFAEGSETFQRDTFPMACLEAVEFEEEDDEDDGEDED
ncbi:MAG: YodC family protein [Proteobacteria bacterium]|nr:YodC family protein [Pseudomonadota bacterium]